jgi:hypothetical protein
MTGRDIKFHARNLTSWPRCPPFWREYCSRSIKEGIAKEGSGLWLNQRRGPQRRAKQQLFGSRLLQKLLENLDFERLLAEKPLQLAHLPLQGTMLPGIWGQQHHPPDALQSRHHVDEVAIAGGGTMPPLLH